MPKLTLTSKRQATFPLETCNSLGLKPGDVVELEARDDADGRIWVLRPRPARARPWVGALDYKYNGSITSAQTAAEAAATANGVTSTGTCPISDHTKTYVCINIPPVYGANAGTSGFVEALISQPNQTIFMPMVSHTTIMSVGARAVAGSGTSSACIWTLAKSGKDISLTGSGSITAKKCSIYDDSNASNALVLTGSGSVSAKALLAFESS